MDAEGTKDSGISDRLWQFEKFSSNPTASSLYAFQAFKTFQVPDSSVYV